MKHVCNVEGCGMRAVRYPRVKIWAKPDARGWRGQPMTMFLPMAICPLHQDHFPVQDFLHPAARVRLSSELAKQGKAPADFDSAKVEWARVGDADWCRLTGEAA